MGFVHSLKAKLHSMHQQRLAHHTLFSGTDGTESVCAFLYISGPTDLNKILPVFVLLCHLGASKDPNDASIAIISEQITSWPSLLSWLSLPSSPSSPSSPSLPSLPS